MKNKIILLTDNNFFGQTRKPWVSMNTDKMVNILQENGFAVQKYCFHEVVNAASPITDSIIFYSFSQKENLRNYIKDTIYYLDNDTNILIPSYEFLKCHENKGYQELYKKKIGFHSLDAYYFSSLKELDNYELEFPLVVKETQGSNAKGVFLVYDEKELIKVVKNFEPSPSVFTLLDLFRRKYFRRKKKYALYPNYDNRTDYHQYRNYILKGKKFIIQRFIPNLKFDYRILVLQGQYYVEKRLTRKNDFRASGSKKFILDFEVDKKLLDYTKSVYERFNTPFLSMDILFDEKNYYLSEFQALHFGINVFMQSRGYYEYNENHWVFVEKKPDIELEMAMALIRYINLI